MILSSEDSDRAVNLDRLAEEDLTPVLGPAKRLQRLSTDSFGRKSESPIFSLTIGKGKGKNVSAMSLSPPAINTQVLSARCRSLPVGQSLTSTTSVFRLNNQILGSSQPYPALPIFERQKTI